MSDVALSLQHVYKMFRKGEVYNSLRDLIPALTGRMFRQQNLSATDKREFWALEDVSFDVKRGEAFGIIGPNGAGKSTMLKLLSRVMKPTRGSFILNGRCSALIELGAGFHQDLTGRENVFLYGSILGMTKREIAAKFDAIVEFSGLADFMDTPVKHYSSGMYARLGFAVASHVNPDVLLVDEVLSIGDYVFQRKCLDYMKQVIRNGSTVLFVSHHLKTIAEFCQKCLFLEQGRALMIGPVEEVISSYLNRSKKLLEDRGSKQVIISKVTVRDQFGVCSRFPSGEMAWIDVEVKGQANCSKLAVVIYLTDDKFQIIFDTSTERLGYGNFTLDEGDLFKCTFQLRLNLPTGLYHPSVIVYRYDTQTPYDKWEPAATIQVNFNRDVRGFVNCFPELIRQEICRGTELAVAATASDPGRE
jgi:ABC-type polysaccharide/polyol phosphate transport system ATPase subunit